MFRANVVIFFFSFWGQTLMSVLRPLLLLLLLLLAQPGTAGDKLQNCFDSTLRGKTVDVRLRGMCGQGRG